MGKTRRWYDATPILSASVETLIRLPDQYRDTLADGVILMAEQRYHSRDHWKSLKSLGKEKILALYRARQKKREPDSNPFLYDALHHLMILPRESQLTMARDMQVLFRGVSRYVELCRKKQEDPAQELISRLVNISVSQGPSQMEAHLKELALEMEASQPIELAPTLESTSGQGLKTILEETERSLKLTRDRSPDSRED